MSNLYLVVIVRRKRWLEVDSHWEKIWDKIIELTTKEAQSNVIINCSDYYNNDDTSHYQHSKILKYFTAILEPSHIKSLLNVVDSLY